MNDKHLFIDKSDMYSVLCDFNNQIESAINIGNSFNVSDDYSQIQNIVICGLGGSAISGDLLRNFLSSEINIPIFVNRNYTLPGFVNEKSLVILSSYSGNTEETLNSFKEALKRKSKLLCITSGGELNELTKKYSLPVIIVPGGLQPRCAVAFSFFPLLIFFIKSGLIKLQIDFAELIDFIKFKTTSYKQFDLNNQAFKIATELHSKLVIIYSTSDLLESVNMRWRTQLHENAKTLAYGNVIPEMNHNEIVGWEKNSDLLKRLIIIILEDINDFSRNKMRSELVYSILKPLAGNIVNVRSDGKNKIDRIFDLIHLGDWVSYHLAILNEADPTPVEVINFLKSKLAEN
jgi:glucose/mannose-6-phosphate isomerase